MRAMAPDSFKRFYGERAEREFKLLQQRKFWNGLDQSLIRDIIATSESEALDLSWSVWKLQNNKKQKAIVKNNMAKVTKKLHAKIKVI